MKIKKNECLFIFSYILLFVSLFIGDIYKLTAFDQFTKSLRLCSYALIFSSCIMLKLPPKKWAWLFVLLMVTIFYGLKTGDLYWSILILMIYNARNIEIKNLFKLSTIILIIGSALVLVCCAVGILPDVLTTRDTVFFINYNRHSFGFYHSNVLPLLIFYLEAYYVCFEDIKIDNLVIMFFFIASVIAYFFCRSRNAFIMSVLLSIFLLGKKFFKEDKLKKIYRMTALIIPCLSIFSITVMILLVKGGIWDRIDSLFSGRFRLAIFKMRRVGFHLINFMSNQAFVNDNIVYADGRSLSTVVLDNGYLYITLRYGILILLFYILVGYLLAKKNKNNAYVLGTLMLVFIINFVDNDLVDYSFLPFILWAFNNTKFNNALVRVKKSKKKYKG